MGIPTTGSVVRNHSSSKNGKRIDCNVAIYVPFVVRRLSTSSSTSSSPASPTSSSQDTVIGTENPATERSEIMSEESRGNPLHEPTKTENKNKNDGREEVQSDLLHDLPDWLQDFRAILVDESSPSEPRSNPAPEDQDTSNSSHELPMGSRAKVAQSCGQRDLVSALAPEHWRSVALERCPIFISNSACEMSLMECGLPGNFMLVVSKNCSEGDHS